MLDDEFGVPEDIFAARNARKFLRNLYVETENLLKGNLGLLNHLTETLTKKRVLNQREFMATIKGYAVKT